MPFASQCRIGLAQPMAQIPFILDGDACGYSIGGGVFQRARETVVLGGLEGTAYHVLRVDQDASQQQITRAYTARKHELKVFTDEGNERWHTRTRAHFRG